MKDKILVVRIDDALKRALEREAAKDHRSLSSLVLKILNEWLAQKKGKQT